MGVVRRTTFSPSENLSAWLTRLLSWSKLGAMQIPWLDKVTMQFITQAGNTGGWKRTS